MTLWSSEEAKKATRGRLVGSWSASGVSIDSRTLQKGDLFIALNVNRDGHDFVNDAFCRGAAAALVSRIPDNVPHSKPLLVVKDVKKALENLALASRRRSRARILAVTGSVGKTSTKDMLNKVLSCQGPTHVSYSSYNNQWGVPLSLARMPKKCTYAVFEIGMNSPGEIAPLARLVSPHVALITTVAGAHLEFFNSVKEIAKEKASIIEGLLDGGTAVLPADIPDKDILGASADKSNCNQLWFASTRSDAFIVGSWRKGEKKVAEINLLNKKVKVELNSLGSHFLRNSLGVLLSVMALGGDANKAVRDLSSWKPVSGRGRLEQICFKKGKIYLIDDSYNSNPASLSAAMILLAEANAKRRIAILGDMKELGKNSVDIHKDIAKWPSVLKVDLVHTVGPLMQSLHEALPLSIRGVHRQNAFEMSDIIESLITRGDTILIKGSLSIGMQQIIKTIKRIKIKKLKR